MMTQEVKSLRLSEIIATKGAIADKDSELITEDTYIFEPSALVVIAHMEMSMMRLALLQMIYDSRLAQHASRFKAMKSAKKRATQEIGRAAWRERVCPYV